MGLVSFENWFSEKVDMLWFDGNHESLPKCPPCRSKPRKLVVDPVFDGLTFLVAEGTEAVCVIASPELWKAYERANPLDARAGGAQLVEACIQKYMQQGTEGGK